MRGKRLHFKGMIPAFLILIVVFSPASSAFAVQGNLTVTDREIIERLTRLEEGQRGLEQGLNKRIDDVNKRIDDLRSELGGRIDDLRGLILGGFGVIFAGIFALIGFVIWDRRSAMSPVINRTREMEEEKRLILKVMKQYSQKEPEFAEVMRSVGLL